ALRSRGPGGPDCRLDRARLDRLVQALEQGPAAHGYTEDRRWTLARVAELVARLFAVRYTPAGMSLVLHRIGYSPQVPARRADRRDEAAVTAWRRESWARGKP
ncbi:winged helix-turn-helix domain-containing protein, partial [Saccharothrix algeriensis]